MCTLCTDLPQIEDDRLAVLAARIRPVARSKKSGSLHWLAPCDLRATAFTWDPILKGKAHGLVELAVIETLHSFGSCSAVFKPSVAEVLAQVDRSPGLAALAVAFTTVLDGDALSSVVGGSYHRARTTLYRRA